MARHAPASVRCIPHDDHVLIRLTRPERYNVLDAEALAELAVSLEEHGRCGLPLVIEGDGGVFSLGADIRELATFSGEAAATYSRLGQQAVAALEAWQGVTIAHLRGYAMGTALEVALGCDLLVADARVRIGLPGLMWALMPCLGGLRRLHRRVGPGICRDLFLRGLVLDGPAALDVNLLDRLIADRGELLSLIGEMGEYIPGAVSAIRDLRVAGHGLIDADQEAGLFAQAFASGECQRRLRYLL